jgi:hypothetical protein
MSGPDIVMGIFLGLFFLAVGGGMLWGAVVGTEDWREKRALIRLARTYGIEWVPGEDTNALRAKVLQKRDAGGV